MNGVTTYFVYDGQTLIREMHKNVQTGALYNTATYLTGPRGPEYRRDDTATELDSQGNTVSKTRWYVYDGLGSVVGEVDVNGTLTSSPKYDVYGLVRANPGTASGAMGFVGGLGHLSEAGTGLIYMRARYYDPALGRFISQDPSMNGSNWFAYCSDNPVNEADRDGRSGSFIADLLEELELPFPMSAGAMTGGIFLSLLSAYDNYGYIAHQSSPDRDDGRAAIGGALGILAGISAGLAGVALLGAAGIGAGLLGVGLLCVAVIAVTMGAIALGLAIDNLDGMPPVTEASG